MASPGISLSLAELADVSERNTPCPQSSKGLKLKMAALKEILAVGNLKDDLGWRRPVSTSTPQGPPKWHFRIFIHSRLSRPNGLDVWPVIKDHYRFI